MKFAGGFIVFSIAGILVMAAAACRTSKGSEKATKGTIPSRWLPQFDFDATSFKSPLPEFYPFTRWWWPGNDVTTEELQREIHLFADNAFGGVEIQPLSFGVPMPIEEIKARVLSWDTPGYYEHVKAVMEEARKCNIIVDMTDGSGWPAGGPYLSVDDGFLNLQFATQDINGGNDIQMRVPGIINTSGVSSRLEAVLATKVLPWHADDTVKTTLLDASSTIVLTGHILKDSLHWVAPAGHWKIIAFWSSPAGETGMTATLEQGPVVNHFDSLKVMKNYIHLFGARTGLQPYFGNPMRAIFNDSYEFEVDRHYSPDFISRFKEKRGYDITPWLPANMQKGYNYASYKNPHALPDFSFSREDWRLQYDYDLTLSELLGSHFLKTSKNWMEHQGLLHRTQVYGLNMDMIDNAGLASIPETESMVGPEANLKVTSSGGHLYNKPVISAESVVFMNRAYMTTPQKIRLAVNKLFAAGVNQIIFHGVPYRYFPTETGPEGWYPFSTPSLGHLDFSSNLGEGNVFWKYQKQINQYISRTQYALRSGKPHTDVLIYYPFTNLDGMPDNPEEILSNGYIEDAEPFLPARDSFKTDKGNWARKIYPLMNQLEASGITWEWVNDISIQEAKLTKGRQIDIRGNQYQALILADITIIQLQTAEQIKGLAIKGMKFLATGNLPTRQPSFLNWQENDKRTEQLIAASIKCKNSYYSKEVTALGNWIKQIHSSVRFNDQFSFSRQVQRDMPDGTRIQFIWNKSDQWQAISCTLDKKFIHSYWLNAEDGMITGNKEHRIIHQMAPFSAIILYACAKKEIPGNLLSAPLAIADRIRIIVPIEKWDIRVDGSEVKQSPLFDWRTKEQFRFSSGEGIYTSSVEWNNSDSNVHFFLDLGKVCFTAEVYINGKAAGWRIYDPYILDITNFLRRGTNQIEVRVTPSQLNSLIGRAKQGDTRYSQYKGREDQLMSAGLMGPVYIRPGK